MLFNLFRPKFWDELEKLKTLEWYEKQLKDHGLMNEQIYKMIFQNKAKRILSIAKMLGMGIKMPEEEE